MVEEYTPRPIVTAPGKLLASVIRDDDQPLPILDGGEDEFLAFEQRIDQEMRKLNS